MKKCIWLWGVSFWLILSLSGCSGDSYFESSKDMETVEAAGEKETSTDEAETPDTTHTEKIFVQVAGAVNHPGVYELDSDARVFEAIALAGGLCEDADDKSINQAALLSDGQKVYIPKVGEELTEELCDGTEASQGGALQGNLQGGGGLLDINSASKEELLSLPGIGEAKAAAIIAYRQEQGLFSSPEDIKKVSGIGDGLYKKISDLICVR